MAVFQCRTNADNTIGFRNNVFAAYNNNKRKTNNVLIDKLAKKLYSDNRKERMLYCILK